jgi:D-alanine-D-alanine ligase
MPLTVGVFFGGRSVEHEVSVITGQQALAALNPDRHRAVPVYIGKDGRWFTGDALRGIEGFRDLEALRRRAIPVSPDFTPGSGALIRSPSSWRVSRPVVRLDAALLAMHGSQGEDGCLQGVLECMELPYTGCDVAASALGMDKVAAKALWRAAGLPVTPGLDFDTRAWWLDAQPWIDRVESELGWPVVVKPANLGSSVGLNTARDASSFRGAVEDTARFTPRILVERMITPLREINCAVLGDPDGAESSVCEEPLRSADILSFQDKYGGGGKSSTGMSGLKRELPARLPEDLAERVRGLAMRAFLTLRAAGVARVDFLYHEPSGEVFVNEINTIPGSLSYYLWEASGLPFPVLLDRLLDLAHKRRRDREKVRYTYDTNLLASFQGGKSGGKHPR